jgi:hypothetical protein
MILFFLSIIILLLFFGLNIIILKDSFKSNITAYIIGLLTLVSYNISCNYIIKFIQSR